MRIVAVACLHQDESDVLETLADEAARTTHAHPTGRAGCVLHALALASALSTDPASKLDGAAFLDRLRLPCAVCDPSLAAKLASATAMIASPPSPREVVAQLGNGVSADESVPLALFAFAAWQPSFKDVVRRSSTAGTPTRSGR